MQGVKVAWMHVFFLGEANVVEANVIFLVDSNVAEVTVGKVNVLAPF